jgi:hypothetical protein
MLSNTRIDWEAEESTELKNTSSWRVVGNRLEMPQFLIIFLGSCFQPENTYPVVFLFPLLALTVFIFFWE